MKKRQLQLDIDNFLNNLDSPGVGLEERYLEQFFISDWLFIHLDQKEKEEIYN